MGSIGYEEKETKVNTQERIKEETQRRQHKQRDFNGNDNDDDKGESNLHMRDIRNDEHAKERMLYLNLYGSIG